MDKCDYRTAPATPGLLKMEHSTWFVSTSRQDFANLESNSGNSISKKYVKEITVNLKPASKGIQIVVNILPNSKHARLEKSDMNELVAY